MVFAPCSLDLDGEIAHGVKLPIARTAPDIPIADRRSNSPARRGTACEWIERSLMFSVGSLDHGQHGINSIRFDRNIRRRSKCGSSVREVGIGRPDHILVAARDASSPRTTQTQDETCIVLHYNPR